MNINKKIKLSYEDIELNKTLFNYYNKEGINEKTRTYIQAMNDKDKDEMINTIKTNKDYKIFIIEDYMSIEYAELLKRLGGENMVLISDIRSSVSKSDVSKSDVSESNVSESNVTDFDICWNTSMMYNWMNIMKPERWSMIKFRMTFYKDNLDEKSKNDEKSKRHIREMSTKSELWSHDTCNSFATSKSCVNGSIDFIKDYINKEFHMCKSEIYLQAWPGHLSHETRMWIEKDDINKIIPYNVTEYEEKLFYYNCIVRSWCKNENENACDKLGFCYCSNCSLENIIWNDYQRLPDWYRIELYNRPTSNPYIHMYVWQISISEDL